MYSFSVMCVCMVCMYDMLCYAMVCLCVYVMYVCYVCMMCMKFFMCGYEIGALAACDLPNCCMSSLGPADSPEDAAQYWGDYRYNDDIHNRHPF